MPNKLDLDVYNYNFCDNPECARIIEFGEAVYLMTVSEMTGDSFPYLPKVDEMSVSGYIKTPDEDTVKDRLYPVRFFCSVDCMKTYMIKYVNSGDSIDSDNNE